MRTMTAIEDRDAVREAAKTWAKTFRTNGVIVGRREAPVYWHEALGVWGAFAEPSSQNSAVRYRNRFGIRPTRFHENTLIEINPPHSGKNLNLQGLFATDQRKRVWILRQGIIRPSGTHVTDEMFAAVAPTDSRVRVKFSDGSEAHANAVANISAPPEESQAQLAAFVRLCEAVRLKYNGPPQVAETLLRAAEAEAGLFLEPTGSYVIGAKAAAIREHNHGRVLKALCDALRALGHTVSNTRVGRYGPDLYTLGERLILFEIKATASAGAVQQGLGQLLLYEQFLGETHEKILVLPEGAPNALQDRLAYWKVRILRYQEGRRPQFRTRDLKAVLKP